MTGNIKIGCCVFILKGNKVLLGKRKTIGYGSWGLPGGKLEYGEKLTDVALRELEEETGIKPKKLELVGIIDDIREDEHYIHISFKLDNFKGKVELKEPEKCEEWKFFPLNKLPENIFFGHIKVVDAFQKGILHP